MAELIRSNVFADFQSKKPHHEDRLTRAFIVVLRLVPLAHKAFLRLVRAARAPDQPALPDLWALVSGAGADEVIYDSQRQSLGCEATRLISILLTDEKVTEPIRVEKSERSAVYDGIVAFPPDWVLTIENKPSHKHVWHGQLSPGRDVEVDEVEAHAVIVRWRDVIRAWTDLLHAELTAPAEARLLTDFLAFVQACFPDLQPYQTLSMCKDSPYLLNERCRWIMEEITPGQVGYHHGWKYFMHFPDGIAKQVALDAEDREERERSIVLSIHPGDVMRKAKALYADLDADRLLRLAATPGWQVRPNFHVAFKSSNLYHAAGTLGLPDYLTYWRRHALDLRQIPTSSDVDKAAFRGVVEDWRKLGFLGSDEVPRLLAKTVATKIPNVNVCPGLSLFFRWPLSEAARLDDEGRFVDEVRARLAEALALWKQPAPTKG